MGESHVLFQTTSHKINKRLPFTEMSSAKVKHDENDVTSNIKTFVKINMLIFLNKFFEHHFLTAQSQIVIWWMCSTMFGAEIYFPLNSKWSNSFDRLYWWISMIVEAISKCHRIKWMLILKRFDVKWYIHDLDEQNIPHQDIRSRNEINSSFYSVFDSWLLLDVSIPH